MYFLEVIAVRLNGTSCDILLKRQLTWRSYLSAVKSTNWHPEQAQAYYEEKTQDTEKLRFVGTVKRQSSTISVYFVVLSAKDHYGPYVPQEALWINADALIQRLLRHPKKFSDPLFESVTKLLEYLHVKREQALSA